MSIDAFDTFTSSLGRSRGRRDAVLGLAAALGMGWAATRFPGGTSGRKKKRNRNKPKKNAFGCLDLGKKCNGKDQKCCSGVCQGKRPRKGKKDTSKCVAHNALTCQADQDVCLTLGTPCGTGGACFRTTGKASFCGAAGGACAVCGKDADCEAGFGPGAACSVCASDCAATGSTACIPAALD